MNDHAFDHVGVFTYSHEEGTSAHALDDDVPAPVKTARRNRLMGLQKRLVGQAESGPDRRAACGPSSMGRPRTTSSS